MPSHSALDHDVAARTPVEGVHARAADQDIVAVAAEQGVVPRAPDQDVVVGAAVRRQEDHAGREDPGVHDVVAGQAVDGQPVVGPLGAADRHEGRQAGRGVTGVRAGDLDDIVPAGAVDDDGVDLGVTGTARGDPQVDAHV